MMSSVHKKCFSCLKSPPNGNGCALLDQHIMCCFGNFWNFFGDYVLKLDGIGHDHFVHPFVQSKYDCRLLKH